MTRPLVPSSEPAASESDSSQRKSAAKAIAPFAKAAAKVSQFYV